MCLSCTRIGSVAPSTCAWPARPCDTLTVRAPRPLGSVVSSVHVASSIDEGGSAATPCDASVRFRSTRSPPAPTSGNSEIMGGVRVLGIDVGGTFTDAVFFRDGEIRTAKVPTSARQEESVVAAARAAGAEDAERFTHGTTIATNALLERKGARTAFVTNAGFEHLLHLRRQNRADLYRLCAAHPEPLVPLERCAGVRGRMGPHAELEALDLDSLPDIDAEAVAICLLHAYRDPSHERTVASEVRRRLPSAHVVASHEIAPEFREYERASTTAIDAYLGPAVARYLRALAERCAEVGLPAPLVMRSSGGVADLEDAAAHPAIALVSGPAAGVVGAAKVAHEAGFDNAIAFDMGGTSTDVCSSPEACRRVRRSATSAAFPS